MKRWLCFLLLGAYSLEALPEKMSVQSGTVSTRIEQGQMHLDLEHHHTVLNWEQFNLQKHEKMTFHMPANEALVVNRVTGGALSEIHGAIKANGNVWLLNPAGVLVGPHAVIETAGFLAAAFDVLDEKALVSKDLRFTDGRGEISVLGKICCPDGSVCLLAKRVDIQGEVEARSIQTGAGKELFLMKEGRSEYVIQVDPDLEREHPYAYAIRIDGSLDVKEDLILYSQGTLDWNGSLRGQAVHGDFIADRLTLEKDTRFETPKSHFPLGGSRSAKDPSFPLASYSWIQEGAFLDVSGQGISDGGSIVLWGSKGVSFQGEILNRSGSEGGKGGFVEVSSHGGFLCSGPIDLRGKDGNGLLLWDPVTVTISTASSANVTLGNPTTFSANTATINNGDLQTYLATGSVLIDAINAAGAGAGTITWSASAPVSWSAGNTLSLNGVTVSLASAISATSSTTNNLFTVTATGAITVSGGITVTGTAGNTALSLTSSGTATGSYVGVSISSGLVSNAGNIVISGKGGTTGGKGISYSAGSSSLVDGATLSMTGTAVGASGGTGANQYGVELSGGTIAIGSTATGGSSLILSGTGGGGSGGTNAGVAVTGTTLTITGASTLLFTNCQGGSFGSGNSSSNYGVYINRSITTNDAGASIKFGSCTGGGDGTGTLNHGVLINGTSLTVSAPSIQMNTVSDVLTGGINTGSAGFLLSSGMTLGSITNTTLISLKGSASASSSLAGAIQTQGTVNIADGGTLSFVGNGNPAGTGSQFVGVWLAGGTINIGNGGGGSYSHF